MAPPSPRDRSDLALDLAVEAGKLDALVDSLEALAGVEGNRLRTIAIALWPELRGELNAFQQWLIRAT